MIETEKKTGSSFREKAIAFFLRNLLFFGALLLSLQIWFLIRYQFQITKSVDIDLSNSVQTQEGEIPLGTPTPEKVTVSLNGSKGMMDTMSDNKLKIVLNTEKAKKEGSKYTWKLKPSDVETPFGIRPTSIKPNSISLIVDQIKPKEIEVEVVLDESQLPKGFKVGKVTADPKKIIATGPSSKLEKIKSIRTLPVPLDKITRSFDCDMEFDTKSYPHLDFDRKSVLVQVEILRAMKTRKFETLPVRILIPPDSKRQTLSCEIVSSPTVDLQVTGEENIIDLLRKEDIFIFANISSFTKPGLYRIDLRCAIGKNGITEVKISPSEISVKLEQISKR